MSLLSDGFLNISIALPLGGRGGRACRRRQILAGEAPALQILAGEAPALQILAGEAPALQIFAGEAPALLCGLLMILLSGFHSLAAETIELRPAADTTLLESAPRFNMGAELHVAAGTTGPMADLTRNRALIRFDLSGIPTHARVESVALSIAVVGLPGRDGGGGPANSMFALHKVHRAWGEGTKLGFRGEFATVGEATWEHALAPAADGSGGVAWSAPGGMAPADFAGEPSGTNWISGLGRYQFESSAGFVADVQGWIADPAANFGWILMTQSESRSKTARRFGSREDVEQAPVLTIQYTAQPEISIENPRRVNGMIQFEFNAGPGSDYTVQFRDVLNAGAWSVLTNIPPQPVQTNVVIQDPIRFLQLFYRIAR